MSDETQVAEDKELEQMEQQLMEAEANGQKATMDLENSKPVSSPEPAESSPAPEPVQQPVEEVSVTPNPSTEKTEDDPVKWGEAKGIKTLEDAMRALKQKEQEFHKRNQAGHPGYQDLSNGNGTPPPPTYQPRPEVNQGYGYQMPPPNYYQPQPDMTRQVAQMYGFDPEDVRRMMPFVVDTAKMIVSQERQQWEQKFGAIERNQQRSNELLQLAQDPDFRNPMVQKEIHTILDTNPTMFNGKTPYADAFNQALSNLARKQLQQGVIPETKSPKPPTTAGGGNGSATYSTQMTPEKFEAMSVEKQEAFLASQGAIPPKR
jgi:hypothetical protein